MGEPGSLQGLTDQEAAARLRQYGPNQIRQPKRRTLTRIVRDTFHEPMFIALLGAAVLYLAIGDLAEGLFMAAGAVLALGLVIVQEARSERALEALNALAEPRARVVRNGETRWIAAHELVPGDVVLISEGGRVPADAILVHGDALQVDESTLTGESAAVVKSPDVTQSMALSSPGEAHGASLFAGTMVNRGNGTGMVVRTGGETQVGRIGLELGALTEGPTLVQRDVRRLIGTIGILALGFCGLVALVYGLLRGDWVTGILNGLTLAISLIPEEFPMVLTIFMALGALRLARRNVLVRRSAVIETLGATDLLCVDKTGTLTENRMRLRYLWSKGVLRDLDSATPKGAEPLLTAARGASTAQGHDPMDVAINAMAGSVSGEVIRTYPLSARLLAFVQVWRLPNDRIVYAAKGAHDVLLPLCGSAPEIDDAKRVAQELAEKGARVLAVAAAEFEADPQSPPDAVKFRLVGLLGFEDPVREDVPAAIEAATRAGVSVAMITGDYPATAAAIGAAAGIDVSNGVLTGEDVERLDELPSNVWVFARTKPEQKLALVRKFKRSGHVVAMTGDGVNDGPALAAADVGIAMGQRGTDVAREAADLILLDDRFASIVGGIALGRRIFANLQRAMTFITAAHIPIAGLALLPLLLGLPPLFYPMHIVLLELIFDPLCSIVFEGDPGRSDVMAEPPRKPSERLFGIAQVRLAAIQGTILMLCILGYYMWLHRMIPDDALARSCAFLALVIGQLSLALAEGSAGGRLFSRQRIAFWSIAAVAALLLALTMTVPFLVALLRFEPPPLDLLLVSILIGGVAGGWSGPVLTYRAGRGARRSEAQSK